MIRRPPRSTRTGHTLSLHDSLPILQSALLLLDCLASCLYATHFGLLFKLTFLTLETQALLFESSLLLNSTCCCRVRSEEHTSELQSLMRISYAVFCLKKKKRKQNNFNKQHTKSHSQQQRRK